MDSSSPARRALWVGLAVAAIFALALFLRAYWNLDVAHQDDGSFVLSGGSDPYYHKRAIDCISFGGCTPDHEAWSHFLGDPLLNYPFGSINPNPPLFQWQVALTGAALDPVLPGGASESLWWATVWSPAMWGALTILPIYFLGAALWSRKAGLISAFFFAVSTTAIDHTALGDADHDAIVLFFITISMLFYVKMLQAFKGTDVWVAKWSNGAAIASGLGRLWTERSVGFAYAGLSGMGIAAVALVWKGFPYVIGIMFLYGVLMLVVDHWRNRDSSGLFLGTTTAFAVGVLAALPYYVGANLLNFVTPVFFILLAWLVVGLVLVPTRDLPTILVMPGFVVAGIAGMVGVFYLFPAVWRSAFYALVYFRQTALYQTIAEAHPADFNTMVFGVGPVVFLLAVVGIGWIAWGLRKGTARAHVFVLLWALLALYMAQSAVRFLFNAVPVLVLVAGAFTGRILEWVGFQDIRKEWAGAGTFWGGFRRGVKTLHIVTALLMAFLLILPQVVLAFDAAVPPPVESQWQRERLESWLLANGYNETQVKGKPIEGQDGLRELYVTKRLEQEDLEDTAENRRAIGRESIFFVERRLGAFGQGFLDTSWQRSLAFLDRYSAENWSGPVTDRPAFLAWWDYGHWAISVGHHPSVADNFQNGYQFAANFLLAQNETHAIQLLAGRMLPLLPADRQLAVVQSVLPSATSASVDALTGRATGPGCPSTPPCWRYVPMTDDEAVRLVAAVEAATGKKIRYFTVDGRMMPLDDPQTAGYIDRSSIFYAPVVLKGDDASDYLVTKYTVDGREMTERQLEERVKNPALPAPSVTGQSLEYRRPFINSMYYRAFVGPQPTGAGATIDAQNVLQAYFGAQPGSGLKHFRAIYADAEVRILEYYPGVNLTGRVVDEAGNPVAGAAVTVYDDLNGASPGVGHGQTVTGADGSWSLLAPFSTHKGVFLDVSKDNVRVANRTVVVPHDAARNLPASGTYNAQTVADLVVAEGTVQGKVFFDENNDGKHDAANETTSLAGLSFTVGQKAVTVDANNTYRVTTLAGEAAVSTSDPTYSFVPNTRVRVEPGATARTQDLRVTLRPVNVTGDIQLSDLGDVNLTVPFASLQFLADPTVAGNTARNATATGSLNGTYSTTLTPGTYKVTLSTTYQHKDSDGITVLGRYTLVEQALVVPKASPPIARTWTLDKQA